MSPVDEMRGRRYTVSLATSAEIPHGDEDFAPLIEALAAEGVEAGSAV